MSTHKITDVIIHVEENLSQQQFADITNRLARENGVISFGRNPRTPRFLMVIYNASRTRSRQLLDVVTGLGHQATLVGM